MAAQACRTDSTLPTFCIGGQIDSICADGVDEWPDIRVTVELEGATRVQDPTNCAFLTGWRSSQIIVGGSDTDGDGEPDADGPVLIDEDDDANVTTNGCWCTCPLPANINTEDANLALLPSGTTWKITVEVRTIRNVWVPVISGESFQINSAVDYDAVNQTIATGCGDCINICYLLDALPSNIPTATFCNNVLACLPAPSVGPRGLTIDGSFEDGLVFTNTAPVQTCVDVAACLTVTTNGTATGVAGTGPTWDIITVSGNPGNLITLGSDGSNFLDCDGLASCFEKTTAPDGSVLFAYPGDSILIPGPTAITTETTALGVTTSVVGGVTVTNITLRDPNAANVLSLGSGGGVNLTAADICAAVNATCPGLAVQNPDGSWTITGTDGNAVTIPAPIPNTDTFVVITETSAGVFSAVPAGGGTPVIIDTNEVIVSADPDNLASAGLDGGAFIECAEVLDCINIAVDDGNGGNVPLGGTGSPADPFLIPAAGGGTETALALTTNGSALGVAQSGTNGHVADIRVLSQDADNQLEEGTDGGVFYLPTCEAGDTPGSLVVGLNSFEARQRAIPDIGWPFLNIGGGGGTNTTIFDDTNVSGDVNVWETGEFTVEGCEDRLVIFTTEMSLSLHAAFNQTLSSIFMNADLSIDGAPYTGALGHGQFATNKMADTVRFETTITGISPRVVSPGVHTLGFRIRLLSDIPAGGFVRIQQTRTQIDTGQDLACC